MVNKLAGDFVTVAVQITPNTVLDVYVRCWIGTAGNYAIAPVKFDPQAFVALPAYTTRTVTFNLVSSAAAVVPLNITPGTYDVIVEVWNNSTLATLYASASGAATPDMVIGVGVVINSITLS